MLARIFRRRIDYKSRSEFYDSLLDHPGAAAPAAYGFPANPWQHHSMQRGDRGPVDRRRP